MASNSSYQNYDNFSKKGDLKSSLIFLITNIALNARNNGRAIVNVQQLDQLLGWGGQIETVDSIISVMLKDDTDYKKKKKKLIKDIEEVFLQKKGKSAGRWELKNLYQKWFRLICNKLQAFEVYPELKVDGYDD